MLRRRSCLALLVSALLVSTPAAVRAAQDDPSGQEGDSSAAGSAEVSADEPRNSPEAEKAKADREVASTMPEQPPRQMTRAELQREIDFVRRELENLLLKIGDDKPTEEQQAKEHALVVKLSRLRSELAKVEAQQAPDGHDRSFGARWVRVRNSLADATRYDVKDGMFRIEIGVKLQFDFTYGEQDRSIEEAFGEIDTSFKGRRARLFGRGRLFRALDFKLEWDFAVDNGVKDAFLEGAKWVKYFRWRVGNFREPFSLGRQTGSNYHGLMEWALPVAALAPGRAFGLMLLHTEADERMTWAVSATTDSRDEDTEVNSDITLTARVTGLPLYRAKGKRLVHLGVGYSRRQPTDDKASYSARPEARFAPTYLDTGPLATESVRLLGIEGAAVWDRFWAQAEWIETKVDSAELANPGFEGAYLQAGWFLTGESRFYRRLDATFGRITPNRLFRGGNPFKAGSNGGAIEVTGRISGLDLNEGRVRGGEMADLSLGMNWYLNQQVRFMLNLIHSDVQNVGRANFVLVRFQYNP